MPRLPWVVAAATAAACGAGVGAEAPGEAPKHWGEPRFKGKRVLVTGGDSGIGLAAVRTFYLECAKVLLVGHSASKSQAASEEIGSLPVSQHCSGSPPAVAWAAADISDAAEVAGVLGRMVREFGGLDIAVNNAGTDGNATYQIGEPGFLTPSGHLYDESIWAVNVGGTLKCMDAEIAHWLGTGTQGVVVNIASVAGETGWAGPLYTSSKWAMIGFTKQAALRNAGRGIRVHAVAPGAVNTTMLRKGMSPSDPRWVARREAWDAVIPAGRIAEPWEMAGPISFLASDMASYGSGMILTADGGLTHAAPAGFAPGSPSPVAGPPPQQSWGQPRFRGKRVVVTGGDDGIGFAAVEAFYLECARVLLAGHNSTKVQAAVDKVRALGVPAACAGSAPMVAGAAVDISKETQVSSLMDRARSELGGLDIAVNNAGIAERGDANATQIGSPGFVDPSGSLHDQPVLDVNLAGTLKCMNAQIAHFKRAGAPGAIINVASICGEMSWCSPLYSASKAAMISFSQQAALTYARDGIRVNVLAPGAVDTAMLRNGRSPTDPAWLAVRKMLEAHIPSGRIAEPWEMAGPITFLASDMASYVTGEVATVDGGLVMASPMAPHREEEQEASETSVQQEVLLA